jgi:excisionase family DNA binding protein
MTMERLLTAKEVAEILRLKENTVLVWAQRGDIPSIRLGKGRRQVVRFRRSDIELLCGENGGGKTLPKSVAKPQHSEGQKRSKNRHVVKGTTDSLSAGRDLGVLNMQKD